MSIVQGEEKYSQILEDITKKANRNTTCLFPGCNEKPIGSHVIARKTMELIADKGHVLTWLPRKISAFDAARSFNAGRPLEQLYEKPISVGIGDKNKVTFPLFCREHDSRVFAPLENGEFSFQPEQVLLLAFRALCSGIFTTSWAEAIYRFAANYYQHSLSISETLRKLKRLQAKELVLQGRQLYAQIQWSHDYDQLGWSMYLVDLQPCIASTNFFTPYEGDEAKAILNGKLITTLEDEVSFSFLPYKPLNSSVCVISWLRGSQRAQRFMSLNRINELNEKEQQDFFLALAFRSQAIYVSPTWWQSLSEEKRVQYNSLHLQDMRKHWDLV